MPKKSRLRTKNTTTSVILAFNEVALFKANHRPGGTCTYVNRNRTYRPSMFYV